VPAIPSPEQRDVTGAWMPPHSERPAVDAALESIPRERMTFGSLRRKVGRSSPRI
jgi:hypothetical protein